MLEFVGYKPTDPTITANCVVIHNDRLYYIDTRRSIEWIEGIPANGTTGGTGGVGGTPIPINQTITFFDHSCRYNGEVLMNEKIDLKIDDTKFLTVYR